jgi:hypothetical protein
MHTDKARARLEKALDSLDALYTNYQELWWRGAFDESVTQRIEETEELGLLFVMGSLNEEALAKHVVEAYEDHVGRLQAICAENPLLEASVG